MNQNGFQWNQINPNGSKQIKLDSNLFKLILVYPNLLCSYHHISKEIVWKYYYATISISSPTNSGVKISVSLKGFRICNNICWPFFRFDSYRPVCLKKAQNLEVFYSSPFWNLNFEISKVNFLLVFLGHDMKRCVLPFFGKQVNN